MKSKILSSVMKNKWGEGQNTTFYHDLTLEGVEGGKVSIGAKQENPPFLAVGQEIDFEWKDEAKRTIKKSVVAGAFGGKGGKFVDTSNTHIIAAAMTNAVALVNAGTIEIDDLGTYMKRLTDVAVGIKKELV